MNITKKIMKKIPNITKSKMNPDKSIFNLLSVILTIYVNNRQFILFYIILFSSYNKWFNNIYISTFTSYQLLIVIIILLGHYFTLVIYKIRILQN